MAKARSPAYPAIGLKEAVEAVARIYKEDYQNPIPREVAAKHMGYNGLNGKSLGALSALLKYGLLEGRGNDTRVSDRAVQILAYEPGSKQRADALVEAMKGPELFIDLDLQFQLGKASDQAIRSYLLTQKFIPSAADNALRSYRETKALVTAESEAFNKLTSGLTTQPEYDVPNEDYSMSSPSPAKESPHSILDRPANLIRPPIATSPILQEVFNLDEGPVTLAFPSALSKESYEELKAQLDLFLLRQRRRAIGAELIKKLSNVGPAADRLAEAERKDK